MACLRVARARRVRDLAFGCIGAIALACGPAVMGPPPAVVTTIRNAHVHQTGAMAAPSGPHATGPLVPGGSLAFEASGDLAAVIQSPTAPGASATLVPPVVGRARIAGGIADRVELGGEVEFARTEWAAVPPGSIAADTPCCTTYASTTLQARGILVGTPRLGFGIGAELGLAFMPFVRTAEVETVVTSAGTTTSSASVERDAHVEVGLLGRLGFFGIGSPVRGLTLLGGTMVQMQPRVAAARDVQEVCTSRGSTDLGCSGVTPSDLPATVFAAAVGTVWFSLGYAVGPVTFFGEVHGSLVADEASTVITPFGGVLGLRIVIPVTTRARALAGWDGPEEAANAAAAPPPEAPPRTP